MKEIRIVRISKVRGHLMRAREQTGFGWKRWSRKWLYGQLGLYTITGFADHGHY